MKIFIIFFLFVFYLGQISCNNSKKSIQSVTLDFACFKSPYTSFTVDFNSKTLTCKNFGYEPKWNEKTKEMIAVYEKTYKLNKEYNDNLREVFSKYIPDTSTRKDEEGVADGGGFQINYLRTNKDTIKLSVINPFRSEKYKTEFAQIDEFFNVAFKTVTDSMGINTLDETYEFYFSGLPIRKISEHPLTYKIWENISGCREDNKELVSFFTSLPKEQCVIIEIGERKISYCLTEVIAEHSLKKNIHIISEDDFPWIWTELNKLKKEVLEAKNKNKTVKETPSNGVFLSVYLKDSAIFNKWLDTPKEELFKSKLDIEKTCH